MQKFYSIVLMAVALLVGTNVKAGDVTDFAGLQEAIANASTTEQTVINVNADITTTEMLLINGGKNILLNLNNANISTSLETCFYILNGKLDIEGTGIISSTATSGQLIILKGSTDATAVDYSVLVVGQTVNIESQDFAISILDCKNSSNKTLKCAYGVKVNVAGYVYGKGVGMYINGNVQKTTGNVPEITISGTVACSAENYLSGSSNYDPNAIYAAGYGKWTITGTVTGALGIYVKAGDFTLDGAMVIATGEYSGITPNGNGSSGCGDAIVYDSNKSYADHLSIHIVGDTKVTSEEGYAIQELVTSGTKSKVTAEDFKIESGEFTGADDKGALSVTAELGEDVKVNGTITGGTYSSDITEYLSNITGVITPIVNEQTGKTEYVIESKPIGSPDWIADITAADANSWVRLENGGTVTLAANAQAHYLVMQGVDKIIIPAGIALTVDEVVLGADAVIDIQLGGRLVVKGDKGIVAKSVKNILIAAKEGQMGTFLQSPAVKSNMNPSATVTLETKAHKEGDVYVYQRIGVPAVDGIKVSEMKANPASASIALAYWGDAEQDWVWVPNTSFVLQPFQGLALTNQATTEGTKYTMPCRLMGNSDISLPVVGDWTSFANSYMANIDLFELLSDVLADNTISASAYVYVAADDRWYPISYGKLESWKNGGAEPKATELEPMQGFIFNNFDALPNVSVAVSYEDHVWDPVFDQNHATPKGVARRGVGSNTTSVQINIVAENGQADEITLTQSEDFSAAFDNGYDMKAMRGLNPVSIFATSELGDMAELASDNIVGTKLNVATNDETMFKMTFSNLRGEQLAIRDNVTGSTITMAEGAEYFFTVAENSVNERFEIINIKNAPTDVELIQVTEGVKAVYTIMGQYVGTTEKWNVLPVGIYVVDGVKMVK